MPFFIFLSLSTDSDFGGAQVVGMEEKAGG